MEDFLVSIKRNLHYVIQNTKNANDLIDILILNKFLDDKFDPKINLKGDSTEIAAELYIGLLSNKNINQDKEGLLRCFNETGNELISDTLTNKNSIPKKSTIPHVWFEIKPPSKFFVGQEEHLKNLEKWFLQDQSDKCVVVTGSSGIGKSELVKVFAKTFFINREGNCIWLAQEKSSLYDSYKRLVSNFGQDLKDHFYDAEKLKTFVWEIFSALSNRPCLLIIDDTINYDDPFLVLLMEQFILWTDHYLIVTSRLTPINNKFSNFKEIKLQSLSHEDTKNFFSTVFKSLLMDNKHRSPKNTQGEQRAETSQHFLRRTSMEDVDTISSASGVSDPSLGLGTQLHGLVAQFSQSSSITEAQELTFQEASAADGKIPKENQLSKPLVMSLENQPHEIQVVVGDSVHRFSHSDWTEVSESAATGKIAERLFDKLFTVHEQLHSTVSGRKFSTSELPSSALDPSKMLALFASVAFLQRNPHQIPHVPIDSNIYKLDDEEKKKVITIIYQKLNQVKQVARK